jgi:hypothetical protein
VTDVINGVAISEVTKLTTHAGALYAIVYANQVWYIARLDGSTLHPVGQADAIGDFVDLASLGNWLYVTGSFSAIDGIPAGQVAAWDGSLWHALSSGVGGNQGSPNAMIPFDGSIYVGGSFTTAGGIASPYIARWIP